METKCKIAHQHSDKRHKEVCLAEPAHAPTPLTWPDGSVMTVEYLADRLGCSLFNAERIVQAVNAHDPLVDALKTWQKFWDTMPKGQMGKVSFDVGLFNQGFIKMREALAEPQAA